MIAAEFKLIPLSLLHQHERTVLQRLASLPTTCRRDWFHDPRERYPLLYHLLLRHWPELVGGDYAPEELSHNAYYWFVRFTQERQRRHGVDPVIEQQLSPLRETAARDLQAEIVQEIEQKVAMELAANEKEIAVAFSDFAIGQVKARFGIQLNETENHFAGVAPVRVSDLLAQTLAENVPLALAVGTEKARAEFIIAPVLVEIRRRLGHSISLFSGVEWEVDPARGLRGVCDFLLSLSPEQLVIEAPVVVIVEAKKEDMSGGIGQCLAEMVAARIFNQQRQNSTGTIYGVVTTGNVWKFLRLVENSAYVEATEYYINEVNRIVGILLSMFPAKAGG